jgi:hypothetical protein
VFGSLAALTEITITDTLYGVYHPLLALACL